jgi:hypothetical protein
MESNFPPITPVDFQSAAGSRAAKSAATKHFYALFVVLLIVSIPYLRLTQAYFLGYDDFNEVHRAAFEDTQHPSRIFTTRHFQAPKYRPLNRGINYLTYRLGNGNPIVFRTRNLVFHLLNCAILYALGILLFDSIFAAALGAALFGLNPLAHQAVAGAVMTNSAGATMALIAVLFGLWSYRARRHELRWLVLAIVVAWIGVLIYEADVVAPGIIFLYFALDYLLLRRITVRKSWIWTLLLLSAAVVLSIFVLRAWVMPGAHLPMAPLSAIARNAAMYVIALLLPVDSLLANQWLGTPLVSELPLDGVMTAVGICGACLIILVLFAFRHSIMRRCASPSFMRCVFLAGAAVFSILPLLVFNEHPSETYLYLPVAFTMLLVARILLALRNSHAAIAYSAAVLLLVSFACATWGRSQRVCQSAAIAQRILTNLPTGDWRQGEWYIRLANAPGLTLPQRYGLYTYRGLDTICIGDGMGAIQSALQLKSGNEHGLFAKALSAGEMAQSCRAGSALQDPCFWVYPDGRVEQYSGAAAAQPSALR